MPELNATHIHIHLDKPSPAHVDGVLFPHWITDFHYSVFPAAVPVLMP